MRTDKNLHILTRSALGLVVGVTALGFGAGVAGADTPPAQPGFVVAQPDDDPEPQPEPEPIDDFSDGPVDPGPDPAPQPGDDIEQPAPDPEPEPEPIDDIATPDGDDDPNPGDGGPDDLDSGNGCDATHGCEPDCPEPLASCDLTDREPGDDTPGDDTPEDTPEDDTPEDDTPEETPEVLDESTPLGSLPHTGGGIALLTGIGASLTGLGLAIRRWAGR